MKIRVTSLDPWISGVQGLLTGQNGVESGLPVLKNSPSAESSAYPSVSAPSLLGERHRLFTWATQLADFDIRARKRSPNPNVLVRISSSGVGVFRVKGRGPKSSVCPSKPRDTKLFGGTSRDLSVNSPALILSKNSGVFLVKLAKIGSKSAEIGWIWLKSDQNWLKSAKIWLILAKIG